VAAAEVVFPAELYLTFCSKIDQDSVHRLMNATAVATQKNVKHLHLLFQSTGGMVADGVCLYHFFKSLPVQLTVYNVGSVQSIATIAYLGAKTRIANARSVFAIHRTSISPQFAMAFALKNFAETVGMDDRRTEEILREHIKMGEDKWMHLDHSDLWFTAQEAVDCGIADKIGDFAPPAGGLMWNI
jgi:ATP-dependent Clp protease protease subunit